MDRNAGVLVVTESGEAWGSLLRILAAHFECRVLRAQIPAEALALVEPAHVDLVLVVHHGTRGLDHQGPYPPSAPALGLSAANSTLKDRVETLERHAVREALSRHRWNQSRAAAELGLSRVGLANKIKRYRLDRTDP